MTGERTKAARNPPVRSGSTAKLIGLLQHGVGGGDGLGVHFVGPLGDDQIDHFRGDIDIGAFQVALTHGGRNDVQIRGGFVDGGTGRSSLFKKVVGNLAQALDIAELNPRQLLASGLVGPVGKLVGDVAFVGDDNRGTGGVLGQKDGISIRIQNLIPVGIGQNELAGIAV